jgi:glycerol-3-phosphate dehydrogenase
MEPPREVDCLVLGGGITGAGVARDAAIRGLRTLLVDSRDFASGTSHLTSKLIHGGFRYLEHLHFRLVWEGILERERLLNRIAPHLVRPLNFVLPFRRGQWAKWLLAGGVVQLYGASHWLHSGRRSSAYGRRWLRRELPYFRGDPIGITFWDAQANDARLVMATLRSAACYGAALMNYTAVEQARFENGVWTLTLFPAGGNPPIHVRARVLVNATGPWSALTGSLLGVRSEAPLWIKGSHILLRRPRRFGEDAIVIRSVRDGRPLWAVPWENRLMVGTTESYYSGDLRDVRPTTDEITDLFLSTSAAFPTFGLKWDDIRCAYAGVRPIVSQQADSENSLSRRHMIRVDADRHLVTVSGGKLTTFRRMAEQSVDAIDRLLARPSPPRAVRRRLRRALLWPSVRPAEAARLRVLLTRRIRQNGLTVEVIDHLVRLYGSDALKIADSAERSPVWSECPFQGQTTCVAELAYLCAAEHVRHLLDLVKRRTALYFLADECGLSAWPEIIEQLAPILGWDPDRRDQELSCLAAEINADLAALQRRVQFHPVSRGLVACA